MVVSEDFVKCGVERDDGSSGWCCTSSRRVIGAQSFNAVLQRVKDNVSAAVDQVRPVGARRDVHVRGSNIVAVDIDITEGEVEIVTVGVVRIKWVSVKFVVMIISSVDVVVDIVVHDAVEPALGAAFCELNPQ